MPVACSNGIERVTPKTQVAVIELAIGETFGLGLQRCRSTWCKHGQQRRDHFILVTLLNTLAF